MLHRSLKTLAIVVAGLTFIGCSNTKKTDSAAVVDQGAGLSQEEMNAKAHGAADSAGFQGNALNDPNSPLSQRVIYFEYDSSDVQADYRPVVEAHAAHLAANPNTIVTLEGHADERGSREYNLALAERRAQSVQKQMVLLGASAGQVRTVSYGEERPANPGHDESAYGQNRRVEIIYAQ
jgi:peptidoglycan-associated lipoprotein